jgi:hypothetical protein
MSTQLSRLYFLACELHPDLPETGLMALLGKSWRPIIEAGAKHGLAGTVAALPNVNADQVSNMYMAGAETGATPTLEEFRSALAGRIYESICGSDSMSTLDQIKLAGKLGRWYDGRDSHNGDGVIDFDAVVETPLFTKSGFWPLDRIMGVDGMPQEVITVLARPGVGKTSVGLSLAHQWRRRDIGPVTFVQTELAASAMRMKVDGQTRGQRLWRSGVDQLVFGRRGAQQALERLCAEPHPDRLIVFDSITGHCGQGDNPESRTRFADLYDHLMEAKNCNRMVVAMSHVKRGTDMADIESAAGSSAVERFSGGLVYMQSDGCPMPDGRVEIRIESLKNRYHGRVRPFRFLYDYVTGEATEADEVAEAMEALN